MELDPKKEKILKVILLIIGILILAGIGYYSYKIFTDDAFINPPSWFFVGRHKKTTDENKTTTPATPAKETCTNTLTASDKSMMGGWKTFTNTEYNYTFQYPGDWSLADTGINKWTIVSIVSPEEDPEDVSNIQFRAGDTAVNEMTLDGLVLESSTTMKIACQDVTWSFYNNTKNPRPSNTIRAPFTFNNTKFLPLIVFPDSGSASIDSDYGELLQLLVKSIEFK